MTSRKTIPHILAFLIIGIVASTVNLLPFLLSGISPAYNQSSDTTVHLVTWREFSAAYDGAFVHDTMFQNFGGIPSGVYVADRVLVRISEFFHFDLLDWSILVSWITLVVFLSGVYAVVFYTSRNILISFLVTLASVIPVVSLGLSSWGMLVTGFVPKEISVGLSVWLTLVYLRGVQNNSRRQIGIFFALLGLCANWYPPVFVHYALVMLGVEILRTRSIQLEQVAYGTVFLIASPLALYDIFIRAASFTTPNVAVIVAHYSAPLHSLSYLFFHYLRKQILYVVLVGGLWYVFRKRLKKECSLLIQVWFFIWWSTLAWSLIGVGIEIFAPLYMKYLLSRISVWFYFASMILVAYTAYEILATYLKRATLRVTAFSCILVGVLVSQTSVLSVYQGIRDFVKEAPDYRDYLSVVMRVHGVVPAGDQVFANPDGEANALRAYGAVATFVAAKDGNVTLYNGNAANIWFARYAEVRDVFRTKDVRIIESYMAAHSMKFYLYNRSTVTTGTELLSKQTLFSAGNYGLAKIKP